MMQYIEPGKNILKRSHYTDGRITLQQQCGPLEAYHSPGYERLASGKNGCVEKWTKKDVHGLSKGCF